MVLVFFYFYVHNKFFQFSKDKLLTINNAKFLIKLSQRHLESKSIQFVVQFFIKLQKLFNCHLQAFQNQGLVIKLLEQLLSHFKVNTILLK